MNKAVPWNIKGVDFDAREAAKEAARRSGMSVGEWLNEAIAEQASAKAAGPDDFGDDEEASARLRRPLRARRDDRDFEGPSRRRPRLGVRDWHDDDDEDFPRERVRREFAREDRDDRYDRDERARRRSEALLDDAVRAFERGARRTEEKTATAISRVARRLEDLESTLAAPRDERTRAREQEPRRVEPDSAEASLRDLERRIAAMGERIDDKPKPAPEHAPAAPDLARIEAKLNRLLDTGPRLAPQPPFTTAPRATLSDAIAQITRRQRALESAAPAPFAFAPRAPQHPASDPRPPAPPAATPAPAPEVVALLKEVSGLAARVDEMRRERADAPRPPDPMLRETQMLREEVAGVSRALKDVAPRSAIASIESAVHDLGKRVESSLRSAPGADLLARQFDDLARSLETFAPRTALASIESAIHDVGRKVDAARHDHGPATDSLTRQIEEMSRALKDMAPRGAVASVETAVRDLAHRVESIRHEGASESVLRPVEALVGEVKRALVENSPREGLERLEREFRSLVARVDSKRGPSLDAGLRAEIQAQTETIRDMIASVAAAPDGLEKQIAGLSARMELLAVRGAATGEDEKSVQRSVAEIRASLDSNPSTRLLKQLEMRIESLSRKIDDAVSQSNASDQFDELAGRLDQVQKALAERAAPEGADIDTRALEKMMGDLAGKLERPAIADTSRLEELVQSLADRFANAGASPADMRLLETLQGQIARLAETVEASSQRGGDGRAFELLSSELQRFLTRFEQGQAGADPRALSAIQQQMTMLVERIDRDDGSARALASLESAIGDLFNRIEDIRHVAVEAAENAARASVAELAARQPVGAAGAVDPDLTRELADLRHAQERADSRNQATLTAVHETLEKVVDRLAVLEDDLSEAQPATISLASGPAPTFARPGAAAEPAPKPPALDVPHREPLVQAPRPATPPAPASAPGDALDDLIEPGSGIPQARRPAPEASLEAAPPRVQADAIAAARRAIHAREQAAAAEPPPKSGGRNRVSAMLGNLTSGRERAREAHMAAAAAAANDAGAAPEPPTKDAPAQDGKLARVRGLVARRKFLVLAVIGVLAIAAGAMVAMPRLMGGAPKRAEVVDLTQPKASQRAPALTPDQRNAALAPAEAEGARGFSSAPADISGASQFTPPPTGSKPPQPVDPSPVSTINARPSAPVNLRDAAAGGDAAAQFELAVRYFEGRAMPRDPKLSTQWFEKAAMQNSAPAQYRLGSHYERGVGVDKDARKAREWYQRAAEAGNVRAMHNLAVLSAEGVDGKPDYAAAASWFRKAAEFGVRDSQYNLAILYARGLGIEQNLQQSWMWFSLAQAQGDEDAGKKREDIAARLDSKGLAVARSLFETFKPRVADKTANEVPPPPGGWDLAPEQRPASSSVAPAKPAPKGKVTSL